VLTSKVRRPAWWPVNTQKKLSPVLMVTKVLILRTNQWRVLTSGTFRLHYGSSFNYCNRLMWFESGDPSSETLFGYCYWMGWRNILKIANLREIVPQQMSSLRPWAMNCRWSNFSVPHSSLIHSTITEPHVTVFKASVQAPDKLPIAIPGYPYVG
jgi:hypothetical protein